MDQHKISEAHVGAIDHYSRIVDFELREVGLNETYLTWDGAPSKVWGNDPNIVYYNLYDPAEEDPPVGTVDWEYNPETGNNDPVLETLPVGTVVFSFTGNAIKVNQIHVRNKYRDSNAFWELAELVVNTAESYGVPLDAEFENKKLEAVFIKAMQRGKIPVNTEFIPKHQPGTGDWLDGATLDVKKRLWPDGMPEQLASVISSVHDALVESVRANLTPDLLKPQFRDAEFPTGHCYVAAEAIYHLAGGRESGLVPVRLKMQDGVVHWWLQDRESGEVIDPTHDQFHEPVDYSKGKPGGFLTREPSKRAREVMNRVQGAETGLQGVTGGTQPVEVMVSDMERDHFVRYMKDRGRAAWVYFDGTLYLGNRHMDIMREMSREGLDFKSGAIFGWIDPRGSEQKPWELYTDMAKDWQDDSKGAETMMKNFFHRIPPQAVIQYALYGTPVTAAESMNIEFVEGGGWVWIESRMPWVYDMDNNTLYVSDWGAYHKPILQHLRQEVEHAQDLRSRNLIGGYTLLDGSWALSEERDYGKLTPEIRNKINTFSTEEAKYHSEWLKEIEEEYAAFDERNKQHEEESNLGEFAEIPLRPFTFSYEQQRNAKIVDLPGGMEDHGGYADDDRRTYLYMPTNDTLYLAPNNARHSAIFDYIFKTDEPALRAMQHSDSDEALGFVSRSWEDGQLEANWYHAEGPQLPDHILFELEDHFGERIAQVPFNYPMPFGGPDIYHNDDYEDDEPTAQWPTDTFTLKTTEYDIKLENPVNYEFAPFSDSEVSSFDALPSEQKKSWHSRARRLNLWGRRYDSSKVRGPDLFALQQRYQNKCAYCGGEGADSFDHVKPLARGGTNTVDNLLPCHKKCNSDMNDWDMTLQPLHGVQPKHWWFLEPAEASNVPKVLRVKTPRTKYRGVYGMPFTYLPSINTILLADSHTYHTQLWPRTPAEYRMYIKDNRKVLVNGHIVPVQKDKLGGVQFYIDTEMNATPEIKDAIETALQPYVAQLEFDEEEYVEETKPQDKDQLSLLGSMMKEAIDYQYLNNNPFNKWRTPVQEVNVIAKTAGTTMYRTTPRKYRAEIMMYGLQPQFDGGGMKVLDPSYPAEYREDTVPVNWQHRTMPGHEDYDPDASLENQGLEKVYMFQTYEDAEKFAIQYRRYYDNDIWRINLPTDAKIWHDPREYWLEGDTDNGIDKWQPTPVFGQDVIPPEYIELVGEVEKQEDLNTLSSALPALMDWKEASPILNGEYVPRLWPLAFAYIPSEDRFVLGQDHPSIVVTQLAPYAGYTPEQAEKIMDDYYNSTHEDSQTDYYEMYDKVQTWAEANVLFGWYAKDGTAEIKSVTQDNSALMQYEDKALDRAEQEMEAARAPSVQSPLRSGSLTAMDRNTLGSTPARSTHSTLATPSTSVPQPILPLTLHPMYAWLDDQAQARANVKPNQSNGFGLWSSNTRVDTHDLVGRHPHQGAAPRVPPVGSGTSIFPTGSILDSWDTSRTLLADWLSENEPPTPRWTLTLPLTASTVESALPYTIRMEEGKSDEKGMTSNGLEYITYGDPVINAYSPQGNIVGSLMFRDADEKIEMYPDSDHYRKFEGTIMADEVWVHPDYQNTKVLFDMWQKLLEVAGTKPIVLGTFFSNPRLERIWNRRMREQVAKLAEWHAVADTNYMRWLMWDWEILMGEGPTHGEMLMSHYAETVDDVYTWLRESPARGEAGTFGISIQILDPTAGISVEGLAQVVYDKAVEMGQEVGPLVTWTNFNEDRRAFDRGEFTLKTAAVEWNIEDWTDRIPLETTGWDKRLAYVADIKTGRLLVAWNALHRPLIQALVSTEAEHSGEVNRKFPQRLIAGYWFEMPGGNPWRSESEHPERYEIEQLLDWWIDTYYPNKKMENMTREDWIAERYKTAAPEWNYVDPENWAMQDELESRWGAFPIVVLLDDTLIVGDPEDKHIDVCRNNNIPRSAVKAWILVWPSGQWTTVEGEAPDEEVLDNLPEGLLEWGVESKVASRIDQIDIALDPFSNRPNAKGLMGEDFGFSPRKTFVYIDGEVYFSDSIHPYTLAWIMKNEYGIKPSIDTTKQFVTDHEGNIAFGRVLWKDQFLWYMGGDPDFFQEPTSVSFDSWDFGVTESPEVIEKVMATIRKFAPEAVLNERD